MFTTEMPQDFQLPEAENEYDEQLLAQIAEAGWQNVHISAEEGWPSTVFTIGHFHNKNHPEIIVLGLPDEAAEHMLNLVTIKILAEEVPLEPYRKYDDLADGLPMAFVPVDTGYYGAFLGYACWYYADLPAPFPALQMVWPDRDGKFPWEDSYDEDFLSMQPRLDKRPDA
ncbi:MAG: DUF4262 domain-containing protein [Marinobacterium sp.]|nr:DUF4262 domain-containing protein [Marinobacterium sp.]